MSVDVKRKDNMDKDCERKKSCDCKNNEKCEKCYKPTPKPLLLFCGQGGMAQFSSPDDPPVNIGSVTVDTRDLCSPTVKIKFSSTVNLTGTNTAPEALLTFRLFRVCDGGVPLPLNSWVYEIFQLNNISEPLILNTSFAFIFCDCSKCSRLCDYFVEVSLDNLVNATVDVSDIQIQALAQ